MEKNPWFRTLLVLLVFIAGFYLAGVLWQFIGTVGDILLLFLLSWLLAFTLSPLAHRLQRALNLPWPATVMLVYLGVILALVVVGLFILGPTVQQAIQLGSTLPRYAERAPGWVDDGRAWLLQRGIDVSQISTDELNRALVAKGQEFGSQLAGSTLAFAQSVATAFFDIVVILILSFYMILDGERIVARVLDLLPDNARTQAEVFVDSVSQTFGGYLRGMLIQIGIYAACTALIMWLAGLPFVAVVAIFSGLMLIVPIIGAIVAIFPPVLLALFTGDIGKIVLVAVALFVVQQVLLNVVMPKVMSESVGLHPLIVFASLLVGGRLAGMWGAVFGVPVAAVVYSMAVYFYEQNRRSRPSAAEIATAGRKARQRRLGWMGAIVTRRRFTRRPRGEPNGNTQARGPGDPQVGAGPTYDERPAEGDVAARP